jgi:DNA-binding NtrC family response regulator
VPASSTAVATFLVRVLECEQVAAGASRHVLDGVDEVRFERGERTFTRTNEGGARVLVLRVPDPRMSARHARIRSEQGRWHLEDLGSTNGSLVWGERRSSTPLQDGDLLALGSTLFLFRCVTVSHRLRMDKQVDLHAGAELETLNPALEEDLSRVVRVARSALSVLLLGETGTGKDVLARALHELSKRPGPLVAVNCGAIPAPLMEAQLFGHTRGAFTGAVRDELGFVRSAHEGTLFLDEVADLPLASQAALLRVLQSGDVTPVGSSKSSHVSLRVVAATHADLSAGVQRGTFRADLYARLAGFVHRMPPLRARWEDLGLLAGRLLQRHAPGSAPRLTLAAAQALFRHDFPLNIRELEHCLQAALVLGAGEPIQLGHLPDSVTRTRIAACDAARTPRLPSNTQLSSEDRALRDALTATLRDTRGNVTETARSLGKARQQIQRWLRRFELDPEQFR